MKAISPLKGMSQQKSLVETSQTPNVCSRISHVSVMPTVYESASSSSLESPISPVTELPWQTATCAIPATHSWSWQTLSEVLWGISEKSIHRKFSSLHIPFHSMMHLRNPSAFLTNLEGSSLKVTARKCDIQKPMTWRWHTLGLILMSFNTTTAPDRKSVISFRKKSFGVAFWRNLEIIMAWFHNVWDKEAGSQVWFGSQQDSQHSVYF